MRSQVGSHRYDLELERRRPYAARVLYRRARRSNGHNRLPDVRHHLRAGS